MKTIPFSYGPKTIHLYFNANAMFAVEALDEGIAEGEPEALERMQRVDEAGTALLCKAAVILATQGELCRRYLQYSASRIPTEAELLQVLSPLQLLQLRTAVCQSINEGWEQTEAKEDDDIDTGLAELEKKTKL